MIKYYLKLERQNKQGAKFKTYEVEDWKEVSKEFYQNCTDENTFKFFRRIGGSETVQRGYTCIGYRPIRILSSNPSRTERVIREFKIISE